MDYFIGIDGGGSKTAFLLADEKGRICAEYRAGCADYSQIGVEGVFALLREGLARVTEPLCAKDGGLGRDVTDRFYTCFGLPMYGEIPENDRQIEAGLRERFGEWNVHLVNDAEAGWAGSLGLESGVNLVAGTGSIAFGRNDAGECASAGGWSDFYSDEGSCRWLGVKCMELFTKEADGRLPKGALYETMRGVFALKDDREIIAIFEKEFRSHRDRIAGLQRHLMRAACEGDPAARRAYEEAAAELAMILAAAAGRLGLKPPVPVTCSGGLLKAGPLIEEPLARQLEARGMLRREARYAPERGAVLLAAEFWKGSEAVKTIRKEWD